MEVGRQDRTNDIPHSLKNVYYYVTIYEYYETFANSNLQLKSMR
jgi:hypothetical protein